MEEESNNTEQEVPAVKTKEPKITGDETITDDTNIDVADQIELAQEKKSASFFQRLHYKLRTLFSIRDDMASHDEIKERILSGGKFRGTNFIIMGCAILIASVGLNADSIAIIIGAMLISPLMGSILVMSYGTASNDATTFLNALGKLVLQVIISIAVSCIYFLISPVKDPTVQIIARTQPTFFDVIVAIAGGIAGMIGQTRKGQFNNVIPGVAIATAIMPPLCVVGYSLANSQWIMLGMSFYLFFLNFYFIYFSGVVVLNILEVPKVRTLTVRQWRTKRWRMVRNTLVVLLPVIAITILLVLHILPFNATVNPADNNNTSVSLSSI